MLKKVLITGANSPFGAFIIDYLNNKSGYDITCISRTKSTFNKQNKFIKYNFLDNHIPYEISKKQFDYVFHLASAVPAKYNNWSDFNKINIIGPINFFKKLNLTNGATFFNASSSSVYEDKLSGIIDEKSLKTKSMGYGLSKLNFEKKIYNLFQNEPISLISVRIPVLLVPGVINNFIAKWYSLISSNKEIVIFNPNETFNALIDGKSIIDFIFNNNFKHQKLSLNVAADYSLSFIEVIDLFKNIFKTEIKYKIGESSKPNQIISTKLAEKYGFTIPNSRTILNKFIKYNENFK